MNPDTSGDESLGRAANRYVSFQIVSAIVGGIVFLILLFTVFLPQFNRMNQSGPPPGFASGESTTYTVNGHPASPAERKAVDQAFSQHATDVTHH